MAIYSVYRGKLILSDQELHQQSINIKAQPINIVCLKCVRLSFRVKITIRDNCVHKLYKDMTFNCKFPFEQQSPNVRQINHGDFYFAWLKFRILV